MFGGGGAVESGCDAVNGRVDGAGSWAVGVVVWVVWVVWAVVRGGMTGRQGQRAQPSL